MNSFNLVILWPGPAGVRPKDPLGLQQEEDKEQQGPFKGFNHGSLRETQNCCQHLLVKSLLNKKPKSDSLAEGENVVVVVVAVVAHIVGKESEREKERLLK